MWANFDRVRSHGTHVVRQHSRQIYLSNQKNPPSPFGPARTLITVWGHGNKPMVLLAGEHVQGKAAVLEVVDAYRRRWTVEESIRAVKDRQGHGVRLEDIRSLSLKGNARLVLIAQAIYLFLAELRAAGDKVMGLVVARVQAVPGPVTDLVYRLFRGMNLWATGLRRWQLHQWVRGP